LAYPLVVAVRVVETSGPAETESLGAELAGTLDAGDVVLVRGAARALGVQSPITSPSFSIGHRYAGDNVTVSHLDLFRLDALEREDPGLLDDYLGSERIAFVEWPQEGEQTLSKPRLRVSLCHVRDDRRRIEVVDG
jgi:tRNA threonylcarbamoyladenosine biosynthesis protein TsaE